MKRIALDMDEVIADVIPKFLDIYEAEFGYRLKEKDYLGGKIYDRPNAYHLRKHLHNPTFFSDLPVIKDSKEVVEWLTQHFDVYILTSTMEFKNSLVAKYDWLSKNFPFISWKKYIFAGEKQFIQADYMIDDKARNLETFTGKKLLFTACHNLEETRFTRMNNWQEIKTYFEKELAQNLQPAIRNPQLS